MHGIDMALSRAGGSPQSNRVEPIVFDRRKYGRELLADACEIRSIPGFITAPRPHRLQFYEIALITEGRGRFELDDASMPVAPRSVFLTAPGEVRRWQLERPSLQGLLVFFDPDFFNAFFGDAQFLERLPLMSAMPVQRSFTAATQAFDALVDMAGGMCEELKFLRADTEHALRAETYRMLVALQRIAGPASAAQGDELRVRRIAAMRTARRFSALVEERFSFVCEVSAYAELLGVSTRHLGHCVREATGLTASELIHRRQIKEACRLLASTDMTVNELARRLNFADASYFTRFFKRMVGTTPMAFRALHESAIPVRRIDLPDPLR